MSEKEMKEWILNASYEELFRKWRFAPAGDPFFKGEIGDFYIKIFSERRNAVGSAEHTRISKKLGWYGK